LWRLLLEASLLLSWTESAMIPVYNYFSCINMYKCPARYCIMYLQWVDDGVCTDWHDGMYCVPWVLGLLNIVRMVGRGCVMEREGAVICNSVCIMCKEWDYGCVYVV
jgi:hypothetical protein